jgi:hypothetical protein
MNKIKSKNQSSRFREAEDEYFSGNGDNDSMAGSQAEESDNEGDDGIKI